MIETIINIGKLVLAVLPFALLALQSRKVNLPQSDRSKQFPMPVIGLVYVLVAMLLVNWVDSLLLSFLQKIPEWIAALAEFSWMPAVLSGIITKIGDWVERLLNGLNLSFWVFFLSNVVIILAYMTVKKIAIGIIGKAVKTDSVWHTRIAGRFYEYFPQRDKWCVREDFVQVRSFLGVFYYAAVVISCLLMVISSKLYQAQLMEAVFYPVFGIIVVGELFFYLDGLTKREYTNDILGEDEDAYKTVNYSLLRKFLRSIFGDKLLTESTGVNNALSYDVTTDEIIGRWEMDEDPKVTCFASFYRYLHQKGRTLDHNYLHSSLDLLNGKSILFNNPFYNDLIPYAFYPMNRALLSHQKVLVVLGRHAIEEDIKGWLQRGIQAVTNIPFMWRIGVLNGEEQDLDIGIVTRSDVLDMALHNANAAFLENVGYVVVIEPSKLISTAQIGLNMLVKKCRTEEDKKIVYCLCDQNCDGLVDAMSHVLMTSITEVSATKKHLGTSSYMCWEADGEYLHHRLVPNISRYLGLGTELSFAALKNQVSKTKWYGGEAFPVTDMRWIGRQYYYDLTKYAGLPTSQEAMDDFFITSPNFWSAEVEKNCYLTVEDESHNMFEILREFSTRTTEQGFVNVISSEYLLKDYMADNASIFEADAKAIPYIAADYTRSNRNTVLRLVMMMITAPVTAEVLEKELSLLGVAVFDLHRQLWYEFYQCYSTVAQLQALPADYREAVEAAYLQPLTVNGMEWTADLIRQGEEFNLKTGRLETVYSIPSPEFKSLCMAELRSAGYVAEDEKGQRYYLGAELSGHIYQKYLPGQFFTFGGKYYEMQYLTADGQVLVRRAADHINGRPTYRQQRVYTLQGVRPSGQIGAQKDIAGMKVIKEFADITVSTPGYYRMEKHNDFETAQAVSFEGEKNGIPHRVYRNKEILRIELSDLDGRLSDHVRYTVTMLFNEIFQTLFAENQAYICAVTDDSFLGDTPGARPLTYGIKADGCDLHPGAIYIIEDSQLDLGLTVAVERNLDRIFRIMHDYLDWHAETLENSLNPPPDPVPPIVFADPEAEEEKPKKKGFFARLWDTVKGWFKRKPKKKKPTPDEEEPPADELPTDGENGDPVPPEEVPTEETPTEETPTEETPTEETPEADVPMDGNRESGSLKDAPDRVMAPPEEELTPAAAAAEQPAGFTATRKPYHERYYLLFGQESESAFVDVMGTLRYLSAMGMGRNPLKQARDGKKIAAIIEATYKPGKPDARYCDFCGTEIFGVEYETLADGRDRCLHCGRTAIKTGEEFCRIFEDVKRNMESFFGIRIDVGIRVEAVNSKKLHKRLGEAFIPTPASDGRVLGVAIKERNRYTLLVENGSPRMASMLTMAHELTHIWQYVNWNDKAIRKKYGKKMRLEIYEGMAKWVEIQYAYLINEPATAKREEIITAYRDDEYGHGFLRYRANYPFSLGTVITKPTPFMNVDTPLDPDYCGPLTVTLPTDGTHPGDGEEPTPPPVLPVTPIKGPSERNPQEVPLYGRGLLQPEEQQVYDAMLQAVQARAAKLEPMPVQVTDTAVQRIADFVQRDNPDLIWFQRGTTYFYDTTTRIVSRLEFTYCLSEQETAERQKQIEAAIAPFMANIHEGMSDYEVALRVYENIIKLVDYDTIGLERQKTSTITPDVPDDLRSLYGVFVNKKAVCAGYAKAMQYLMNRCGLECLYVTSDTHAWNVIKLEGDYYHLDVTWGDSSDTKKEKSSPDIIRYGCFCLTDQEVARLDAHRPEDILPLPPCTATKCNYHRRHGLYFERFDFDRIRDITCESVRRGQWHLTFKFAPAVFGEAKRQLVDGSRFREAIQFAQLKTGVRLSGSYTYRVAEDQLNLEFDVTKL